MKKLALTALLLALPFAVPTASAQTVAEMLTVTAITSTLESATTLKLPMPGSLVKDPKLAGQYAASLLGTDAAKFTEFNLIVTRGMATRIADAYLNNLKTEFAVKGFFQSGGDKTLKLGTQVWSRSDFQGDSGRTRAIFVNKVDGQVLLFTAISK